PPPRRWPRSWRPWRCQRWWWSWSPWPAPLSWSPGCCTRIGTDTERLESFVRIFRPLHLRPPQGGEDGHHLGPVNGPAQGREGGQQGLAVALGGQAPVEDRHHPGVGGGPDEPAGALGQQRGRGRQVDGGEVVLPASGGGGPAGGHQRVGGAGEGDPVDGHQPAEVAGEVDALPEALGG